MKNSILISSLILVVQISNSHASGSSVGNGFAPESILKAASMNKSKSPNKLCTDASGKVENAGADEVCKLKDGTIKMKDLIEAAKKNDSAKK
ncbi:MAG: hypothetical protein H7281_19325 [Bacteriovorax sp.]|nr:hypothetical protein [Bacteriovorax sp.]